MEVVIRDIWVECCGHLSAFDIEGVRYEQIPDNDFLWGKPAEDMSHKLKEVLEVGMEIGYEYDFGSTTELTIKVVDFYKAPEQKENVTILSRNNPIQFTCSVCGKNPAVWTDPIKMYDEDPFWCEECLENFLKREAARKGNLFFVCAPWARSNGCKSRTCPGSGKCIAEQQGCLL